MSTELKVAAWITTGMAFLGASLGLAPFSPWWLSITGFVVMCAACLTLTVLAILKGTKRIQ